MWLGPPRASAVREHVNTNLSGKFAPVAGGGNYPNAVIDSMQTRIGEMSLDE